MTDSERQTIAEAIARAQKVISGWNEWYGKNGKDMPIPPAGIPLAQDALAEARSILGA